MKKTTDAFEIAYSRYIAGNPRLEAMFREETQRLKLTAWLRELRVRAGISQAELAKRVGTTGSVISRMEDPDYEGHSLKAIQRVVAALGMGLELRVIKGRGKLPRHNRAVVLGAPPPARRRQAV